MAAIDKTLFPKLPRPTDAKPAPDPCAFFCKLTRNHLGFCLPSCFKLCPALCQSPAPPSVHTSGGGYHPHHHVHLSPLLIAMLVLIACGFLVAICYFIYATVFSSSPPPSGRRRRNQVPELDQSIDVLNYNPVWHIATVGLQPSVIKSIAVCEYKKGDGLVQGTSCAVCLAEFHDGDPLKLLPKCCHAFHVPCIDTWLASRTTCPVCRAPVLRPIDNQQPEEARFVEIVDGSSSSRELRGENAGGSEGGMAEEGEGGEVGPPVRRAASMDSLCIELDGKLNSSSCSSTGGCDSLVGRSFSCRDKLFSMDSGKN